MGLTIGGIIAVAIAAFIGILLVSWAMASKIEQCRKIDEQIEQNREQLKEELRGYELQKQKAIEAYKQEVEREISEFAKNSELGNLKSQLANAKSAIDALNKQNLERLNKEDFVSKHTLKFTNADKQDLEIIKEAAEKLNRKQILSDILWTIYYQKPLQELRTKLFGKVSNKVCGIYKITNLETEQVYIGQARDISERFTQHVKAALKGESSKFYRAMAEQGPEGFIFEILEECEPSELNEKEKFWISFYDSVNFGYNTQLGG